MNPQEFDAFTTQLIQFAESHPQVQGLVGLGSFAKEDYQPDAWSDHDFFLIVEPGSQQSFRDDLTWLPQHERIVLSYAETAHGVKALYDLPHLVEFAVFDREELHLARINRYKLYVGDDALADALASIKSKSDATSRNNASDAHHIGQVLTILYVGLGRYKRGERMSGHHFVKLASMYHFIPLITRHVPAEKASLLDNLDPFRRFDVVYPEIASKLYEAFIMPVPECVMAIAGLMKSALPTHVTQPAAQAFEVLLEAALD